MAYIYRHIRLDKNVPFYIGIGSDTGGKYIRAYTKKSRNNYWRHIVASTKYEVEIMMDDLSNDEASEKEIEFISFYGRFNTSGGPLCNLTDGGDKGCLGMVASEETKKKMSLTRKGKSFMSKEAIERVAKWHTGRKRPKETGEKISAKKKGKKVGEENPFFGKKHSEETVKKIVEGNKIFWNCHDRKVGEDHPNYGRRHSEETKKKLSEMRTGPLSYMYGKKMTDEVKEKIKANRSDNKLVLKMSTDGMVIEEYLSIRQAAKENGVSKTSIAKTCKKEMVRWGYFWKFKSSTKQLDLSKVGKPLTMPVSQYSLAGEHMRDYKSAAQAQSDNNIDSSSISRCAKGKQKTAGGFKWTYLLADIDPH